MEIVSIIIHAYTFLLIYEMFTEEFRSWIKYVFVVLFAIIKSVTDLMPHIRHLQALLLCTLLILYSVCIHSKNSYLKNLEYALITYAVDYIFNLILGSIGGFVAVVVKVAIWKYFVIIICRVILIVCLVKQKKYLIKFKQEHELNIIMVAAIMVLTMDQIICLAYVTKKFDFANMAFVCTYVAALFTILWLLDHHKMAKVQKMYAEDNRQMSQKLHRSKEILPMIANYVSNMDGTQDERMREKLEEVCHDYGKELGGVEMSAELFETTGIDLVNLLLRTKIIECGEQDIELDVFVSTQIDKDMKRLDVSDGEITRLLGDLLRNAIHAVEDLSNKMILLLIARDENGCVLIRIYDSGIPFPDHILERFGERGNTTWGTGNGLADLMETVNRVQASIEINTEMAPEDVFTKEISICFDGKGNVNIVKKDEK